MKNVVLIAIGTIFGAYGFSDGLTLPYHLGYILGWSGVCLSIGTSIWQYRQSLPYEHRFSKQDWQQIPDGLSIAIPLKVHKKGIGASVVILETSPNGYAQVHCWNEVLKDGSVVVRPTARFEGKIIVK